MGKKHLSRKKDKVWLSHCRMGKDLCRAIANIAEGMWFRLFCSCVCVCVCVCKSLQSCSTLCHPMNSCPLGTSVHGILQVRYWSGLPSSPPEDLPYPGTKSASLMSPTLAGRFFTPSTTWTVCFVPLFLFKLQLRHRHILFWFQKSRSIFPN